MLKEKDGNKALEKKAQGIETTVKQLKALVENSVKDVETLDQLDYSENVPEEHKKLIDESSDCNNNGVLNETTCCEESQNHDIRVYFFNKLDRRPVSRTSITTNFKMLWFPSEARY